METPPNSRIERMAAKYRADHQHPVNHFLHVGVGWPMVGASLFLLPFRPLWALGLFLGGYAFMFSGHFLFERNLPTILKHPSTPFVMAYTVTKSIVQGIGRAFGFGARASRTEPLANASAPASVVQGDR